MEFKVGDRVRVVSSAARGVVGEVVRLSDDNDMPYPVIVGLPDGQTASAFSHDELTYADDHSHVTDMPDPRDDALDLIAEAVCAFDLWTESERLDEIARVLRETGRLS